MSTASTNITYRQVPVLDPMSQQDLKIFTREAGPKDAPTILLLHGFPTSSHMFRDLIDELSGSYRVIAPDLPGFGFSDAPEAAGFGYTFDHLAAVMGAFIDAIDLNHFALYIFDYGAPVGFRVALSRPERVAAIISQNGNAYEEGLSDAWSPIQAYWREPSEANREALRGFLSLETTRFQYHTGVSEAWARIAPEAILLDQHVLDQPGHDAIQLDLLRDYGANVALYPKIQAFLRDRQPPFLAVWGKNDPFFIPAGAKAYLRDLPHAEVHFVDSGHFALETHGPEIAAKIRAFLAKVFVPEASAYLRSLTAVTAPTANQPVFETFEKVFGFLPNLAPVLGAEPAVLKVYLDMLLAVGATSLSPLEQQVAMAAASAANGAAYGLAVHTALAAKVGAGDDVVAALRQGSALADPRLEAVRAFAFTAASNRTQVSASHLNALRQAGLAESAAVAILLAVAAKTLANGVAHLAQTPIDAPLLAAA